MEVSGTLSVAPCDFGSVGVCDSGTSVVLPDGLTGTISRTRPSSPVAVKVPLWDSGIINGTPSSELKASGVESLDVVAWLALYRELSDCPTLIACPKFPSTL